MRYLNQTFLMLLFSFFCVNGQELSKEGLLINNNITIVDRTGISNQEQHPIAFGKRELFAIINEVGGVIESVQHYTQTQQKVYLILGTLDNNVVKRLVSNDASIVSNKPEGIFYQWRKTEKGLALIVGGTDAIGFMYALTELAQQIKDKGLNALTSLKNTVEFPDNQIRGLDKFVTDENDDSWFFSEDYWQYYIGQLAKNRFNRLTLITGYNDGKNQDFMIPVYPYLFKVPGFENVELKKNYSKSPEQYLTQLRRIGEISHSFGLEFVYGIWGHGRSDELISGLPEDDSLFTTYCANGMRELLRKVPEIDGIHLRVNYESGVGGFGDTADNFWKHIITAIGDIYKERNGNLFLDLRAKGLTVNIREWALQTGINVQVTSKYSCEGVGLPYHPTEMRTGELTMLDNIDKRQRYGYADFLYNSRDFDFIYRLWGIGTMRMFTWADPDYAKRFSHTTTFGGGLGFQVTPPMARKENTWNLFQDDSLVYYKWEDERYWAWYLLFGRLGYSNETNPEVWQRAFREHYGKSYTPVLEAYSSAGKVLPLITSSHLTYHPANYNWAEIESGGALFSDHNANHFYKDKGRTYQSTEPADPGLFYGIEEYVKDVLNGDIQPKINPVQLATLHEKLSRETLEALSKVKKEDIPVSNRKEFASNEVDLSITAALALYHSFKIKAATDFVFFKETQKKEYLKSTLNNMDAARNNWKDIVVLTEKLYHLKPFFLHDNGTWRDRLIEIEKDISKLQEIMGEPNNLVSLSHWDKFEKVNKSLSDNFDAIVPEVAGANKDLKIILKTNKNLVGDAIPKVHYRIANMASGEFKKLKMQWDGANYVTSIPADYLNSDFDLLIYFTSITDEGCVTMHPGLFHETYFTPYFVVEIN